MDDEQDFRVFAGTLVTEAGGIFASRLMNLRLANRFYQLIDEPFSLIEALHELDGVQRGQSVDGQQKLDNEVQRLRPHFPGLLELSGIARNLRDRAPVYADGLTAWCREFSADFAAIAVREGQADTWTSPAQSQLTGDAATRLLREFSVRMHELIESKRDVKSLDEPQLHDDAEVTTAVNVVAGRTAADATAFAQPTDLEIAQTFVTLWRGAWTSEQNFTQMFPTSAEPERDVAKLQELTGVWGQQNEIPIGRLLRLERWAYEEGGFAGVLPPAGSTYEIE